MVRVRIGWEIDERISGDDGNIEERIGTLERYCDEILLMAGGRVFMEKVTSATVSSTGL